MKTIHEEQQSLLGSNSYSEDLLKNIDKVPVSEIKEHWPQDAAALLAIFESRLKGVLGEDKASKYAIDLLTAAAQYGGGRKWYLPTKEKLMKLFRDQQIFSDSRRMQVRDLVTKYQMGESQIYNIIKEQQALKTRRVQPELF